MGAARSGVGRGRGERAETGGMYFGVFFDVVLIRPFASFVSTTLLSPLLLHAKSERLAQSFRTFLNRPRAAILVVSLNYSQLTILALLKSVLTSRHP